MIFLVQFEINKHEQIFSKMTKIARARRASAICSLWKNLQVLIYFKMHEKNHVITYANKISFTVKSTAASWWRWKR